ncbi:MAG: choice-of-anchor D domain-containing protein [Bacteroidota bacterium]
MKNFTFFRNYFLFFFLIYSITAFSQNAIFVVSGNGIPILNNNILLSTLDNTHFGTVLVGNTQDNTFVLTNNGVLGTNGSRRITFSNPSVTITGADAGQFSIISGPSSGNTLNGLGATFSPNLVIRFTPTLPLGTKDATVTIRYTNNGGQLTHTYAIRGVSAGVPEIDILGNGSSIVDGDITPSVTDWTDMGTTSPGSGTTRTFTIQNTATANLSIGLITFFGANPTDFSITVAPSANIAAASSTTFTVTFNPSSNGVKTAIIFITTNDSNENPYNFTLQGTGLQAFFDSDGDLVYDNVDIDDDNDGIKDIVEEANCNSCNGPKVNYKFLNETFGTSTVKTTINTTYNATTTYCYEDGIVGPNTVACPSQSTWILDDGEYCVDNKITGIIGSDPENIHGDLAWYNGLDHTPSDVDGRMAIFNASFVPGTFYETTITGVLSNLPITYSFWVLNIMAQSTFPGSILPNVTVEFLDLSNNVLSTFSTGDIGRCSGGIADNSCAQGVWQQFSTSVNLGSVTTFIVRFKNNAPGGGGNDLALDDILITQTLCDRDNDGVADLYDLDSDNDGLEDVIEAGLANLSGGKGLIDVAWLDVNGNGYHDLAELLPAVLDSDGDLIPNYLDLDSDNDSIFDVDESASGNINAPVGYVNGDGDITGDGVGDGLETETFRLKDSDGDGINEGFGDGILDIYDYGTNTYGNLNQGTNIAPFLFYLLDTDADLLPNYIDVSSTLGVFDISTTLYASLDANNDGKIDGNTDIDKDGILDAFDTNTAVFGSPRDLNRKLFLSFDGRNDFGQATGILGGLANASLMAWINLNSAFANDGIIIGQDNFQLKISSAKKLEATINGTTVTFNSVLNTSQWYNVAVVYGGGNLKLYLNGTLAITQAIAGNINADASLLTIGRSPSASTNFFKGKIDEVRVFNTALTDTQVQRMVYQEIYGTGGQVRGYVIPKDIGTLPYANLLRYYRMDVYKDDIIDNLTTLLPDVNVGMEIYNNKIISGQEAPMPFITERTGDFATAVNSPTKEIRGMDIMDYDWSIVNVKHDITESSNNIDLGMIVDPGKNVVMNNDNKLQNDWYLKLDGKIDLQGRSQLVQTTLSDLEPLSAGSLERDQQGTKNIYNYNYWSSPVGPINAFTNNNNSTIDGVFKDGTNPASPTSINWIAGYNGSAGTPISLARFWLYKFQNVTPLYANWVQITETSSLAPSQGFTLKGSGALTATQNYTFIGKPFNASITNPIAANNVNLSGNPYASAIDSQAFINDNSSSLTGAVYFWEHYTTNNSHNLAEYQGGYACRNLTGGTVPVSPALISGLGSSTRIPGRFIPVGQGFFVYGNNVGGNIVFNNGQRLFIKEDNIASNVMFKNAQAINDDDSYEEDTFAKIRLGYTTQNNYHRQMLLGFMNEKATNGLDYGYDAILFDEQSNDAYFSLQTNKLNIQGDGFFSTANIYPIGVKANVDGTVKFMIDGLENFPSDQEIYIYDADNDTYNDIKSGMFEVTVAVGENTTRFSLRFENKPLGTNENNINDIKITHIQNNNTLIINNNLTDTNVKKVTLYSILGSTVKTWDITNDEQTNIAIPIKNIATGTYIAKVETNNGFYNKKIIIN